MKKFKLNSSETHIHLLTLFFAIGLVISSPTAVAADLVKGQSLYLIHCSGCHGEKGISINPEAPNFASGEQLSQSDSTLIEVIRLGNNAMPAFMGILQDDEILDVISYARTLQW